MISTSYNYLSLIYFRSCIEGLELDIQQISEPPPSSFLSKKLQLESSPKKGKFY